MSRQPPESSVEAATWVDLLRWRARQQPDRRAYARPPSGEEARAAFCVSMTKGNMCRE